MSCFIQGKSIVCTKDGKPGEASCPHGGGGKWKWRGCVPEKLYLESRFGDGGAVHQVGEVGENGHMESQRN